MSTEESTEFQMLPYGIVGIIEAYSHMVYDMYGIITLKMNFEGPCPVLTDSTAYIDLLRIWESTESEILGQSDYWCAEHCRRPLNQDRGL